MGNDRRRIVINRLMQLIVVLHESHFGLTARKLVEKLGRSKSTVHRDLGSLREMGVAIQTDTVNGEARYRLPHWPIVAIAPSPLQLSALCLAREALEHLDGTAALRELDELLAKWVKFPKAQLTLAFHRRGAGQSAVVGALDGAIAKRERIEIEYRGERDSKTKARKVEPIALRSSGEQLYLFGYDVAKQCYRTFKTARMERVLRLGEPANDHSHVDLTREFAHSVKTWTADSPTTVTVRISAEKARFVKEYPLMPNQRTTTLPDGSVEVTADVNGTTEALSWVLSWGAHAEAISPPELREAAAAQVRGAAKTYGEPPASVGGVRKARDSKDVGTLGTPSKQAVSRELGRQGSRVGG